MENNYGFVAVLELNGKINIHERINETEASPNIIDSVDLKSSVLMLPKLTMEECIESVKQKIKSLDEFIDGLKES